MFIGRTQQTTVPPEQMRAKLELLLNCAGRSLGTGDAHLT